MLEYLRGKNVFTITHLIYCKCLSYNLFIYVTLVGYDCYCGLECWFLSCLCGFLLCNVMLISVCVCVLQGPRQISPLGTIKCIVLYCILHSSVRGNAYGYKVDMKKVSISD